MLELLRRHWPTLAAFLALIALVAWAYVQGVSAGKTERTAHYELILAERDRATAQALADLLSQAQAQATQAMAKERAHLKAKTKTEARFRTITKTVTEYVDKNPDLAGCSLDADGLRYWNAANGGGAQPDAEAGDP